MKLVAVLAIAGVVVVACGREGNLDQRTTESPRNTPQPTRTVKALSASPRTSMVELGIGGVGVALFGEDPTSTINAIRAELGDPDEDSGWNDQTVSQLVGACPGRYIRGVRWDRLRVLFTRDGRSDYASNTEHFFAWQFGKYVGPGRLYLRTPQGIGLGSMVADVKRTYGGDSVYEAGLESHLVDRFLVPGPTVTGVLYGVLSSVEDDGRVEHLEYGAPNCGE